MKMSKPPVRPEAITLEWINDVLVQNGLSRVSGFEQQPLGVGRGFYGELVRLDLAKSEQNQADAPSSLVAKFASAVPQTREAVGKLGMYEREVRFYRELADSTPVRTPRCYFSYFDPANQDTLLLMEYMDGELGDDVEGASFDQAAAAATVAGRLHHHWQDNPSLTDFDWIVSSSDPSVIDGMTATTELQLQEAKRLIEPFAPQWMLENAHRTPEIIGEQLRATGRYPATLIHTDFRMANMIFTRGPKGLDVALIDWQIIGRGPGSSDMAILTGYAMRTEDRRCWSDRLFEIYFGELSATASKPDWFDEAYARAALILAFNVIRNVSILDFDLPETATLMRIQAERSGALVEDSGALALL